MLIASDLTYAHGYRPVLRGASIALAAGEAALLLGANGAGKTTLLRVLATLAQPVRGDIHINGIDARKAPDVARRQLGVVLHATMHQAELTGRENLRLHAALHNVPDAEAAITRQLEDARLLARANDRTKTYSRGMLQRLSMARALLHGPRVLLLDEPLTGLDSASVARMHAQLQRFVAAGGTLLMSTHDLATPIAFAHRTLRLTDGVLNEEAT
jgi:heme exporter protein A